jgi:DNA-binding transcriptional ArsR family regulator
MTTPTTAAMPDETTTTAAVAALRFLGDATRLRVVRELAAGPVYGTHLAERLGLPQNLAAYHLRQLEAAGLLRREQCDHRVYYVLDPEAWAAFTQPVRAVCDLVAAVTETADDATG